VVTVIDPGGGFSRDGVGTRDPVCFIDGVEVPCYDPPIGWLHADGCYYKPAPDVGPGPHWWARWCYNPTNDEYFFGGWRQLLGAPTSIENVVQHAVNRLAPSVSRYREARSLLETLSLEGERGATH
jgi:hypothetical protein